MLWWDRPQELPQKKQLQLCWGLTLELWQKTAGVAQGVHADMDSKTSSEG